MEEGEKQGEAMNVTDSKNNEEEGTRSREGGALTLGFRGEGEKRGRVTPPFKGEKGSRGYSLPCQNFSSSFNTSSYFKGGWIFDCGATDTMSYDPKDFLSHDTPVKDIIKTANGEGIKVSGAGTISFTKNLT